MKNKINLAQEYITNNSAKIPKIFEKQIRRDHNFQKNIQAYIQSHPNKLIVFGMEHNINDLSIESLTQMLYTKSLMIINEFVEIMNLHYSKLIISYTKGYLGQCKGDIIKIDYRNVLCELDLLRYLIVHELSHLRYRNHSKQFWNEVATYYPQYKIARKELKIVANRNAEILKYYDLLPSKLH
ncbi:M48 family peptidase [Helicobacter didelphidarum]|uniref:M48 family peptidase n=2 Tax=Helicobacter didelphidarum TaxID=2040648 RepID=A0A3D8ILY3_9HELI|nr:M48 family peptidase [Helicobacter didelphidarum]